MKGLDMDVRLSLIDSRQRPEAVQRIANHQETMFWPAVLSSCLEDLLLSQVVATVEEIVDLLANHGISWSQIIDSIEAMRAAGGDVRLLQSDDRLRTNSQILESVS